MQAALKRAIAVVAPAGDFVVPKTSLPTVDVDRDAPTLAIGDSNPGFDSRPSVQPRESRGGSIPSPVTSRTGSEPLEPPRRNRGLILVGIAAVAAVATVFLWPRAPSSDEAAPAAPAAQVAPDQPLAPAPEPTVAKAKPESPSVTPVEGDAGLAVAKVPAVKKSPVAVVRPKGVPVRPPVSAAAADAAKSTSPPSAAATPAKTGDPLSKRY